MRFGRDLGEILVRFGKDMGETKSLRQVISIYNCGNTLKKIGGEARR